MTTADAELTVDGRVGSDEADSNDVAASMPSERSLDDKLAQAATKAREGEPSRLSVRQLLSMFGASRRGDRICSRIRSTLKKHELVTVPDFEFAYIDGLIALKLTKDVEHVTYDAGSDPTIRVGHLEDANKDLVSVSPDQTIQCAVTMMLDGNFSQLPVMTTPTEVKGAISWRSIAQAKVIGGSATLVRECMEQPQILPYDRSLLDAVELILKHEYVLIRTVDKRISGIITMSDLGMQFYQLGEPFILLGEIENHLRLMMSGKFNREQLNSVKHAPQPDTDIENLSDLTFGQYQRLLDEEANWNRVATGLDRKEFINRLDGVREIRNDIMHFNPDPPAEEDIAKIRRLTQMLRTVRQIRRDK